MVRRIALACSFAAAACGGASTPGTQTAALAAGSAVDPADAFAPRGELAPYAIDRANIEGVPLRGHYPVLVSVRSPEDAAAGGQALAAQLAGDFKVESAHLDGYGLQLYITPLRADQELAPDGATTFPRFNALLDQLVPYCTHSSHVRWAPTTIKRDLYEHESTASLVRVGWAGPEEGWAKVAVSALRASAMETNPAKQWVIWCGTAPGDGIRRLAARWLGRAEILAHPALRVTETTTTRFGRMVDPNESCRGAMGGCDPIGVAPYFVPSRELPPTTAERPLDLDDVVSTQQVSIRGYAHVNCRGELRVIASFSVANPDFVSSQPAGNDIEQTTRHLDMAPIMLDLITGERISIDDTWNIFDLATGTAMNPPTGTRCTDPGAPAR